MERRGSKVTRVEQKGRERMGGRERGWEGEESVGKEERGKKGELI